jgi:hypothetical protein
MFVGQKVLGNESDQNYELYPQALNKYVKMSNFKPKFHTTLSMAW